MLTERARLVRAWAAVRDALRYTRRAQGAVPGESEQRRFASSPQWDGERFRNAVSQSPLVFSRIFYNVFFGRSRHAAPRTEVPVRRLRASDLAQPPESGLRATWMGHSSTLLEIDGTRLLLDPVWSDRASPFSFAGAQRFHPVPLPLEELPPLDAVAISHAHYDHLDMLTIVALRDRVPLWIVPLGVGSHLRFWGVPAERIVELDWWGEHKVGEITVTAVPARHDTGRSIFFRDRKKTLWCAWAFRGPKHSAFFGGDSGMHEGYAQAGERLGPFDLCLIEIGAYDQLWRDAHLGPEECVIAFQLTRGKLLVPVHWATFELAPHSWTEPIERFLVAANKAGVRYTIPRPGQSVELEQPLYHERWWPDEPWRTVEQREVWSSGMDHLLDRYRGV